ncbi:sodium-dependent transporter [Chlamydiales bacterium]|nr:sodium-dependent transporter [Chlamydiales bacterium]
MKRESWGSRLGFILAVTGSAIGLANIWRFPYLAGENGGAAFVFIYLISLFLIGFPVLMAEIVIGRAAHRDPAGAFKKLSGKKGWGYIGLMTIFTGFLVSSFYSAIAGWIVGYLIESIKGNLTNFATTAESALYFDQMISSPLFTVGSHFLFLGTCVSILFFGVRGGIERGNKIFMPLLFAILILMLGYGLTLPNAGEALTFLWKPDFSALTPTAILAAVGQSFFTLSLGQGTMVTYGSYLKKSENLIFSCLPIILMDTLISLIAATVVFTIVFSVGMSPGSGPALVFHTLPVVFSQIPFGAIIAPLFFLLITLAAVTSEISALEPAIAYLIDEWKIPRNKAVSIVGITVFLVGIPSALSGFFLDSLVSLVSNLLIPLGGLAAVVFAGWFWGTRESIKELKTGARELFDKAPFFYRYFSFCFKYLAPVLIGIVLLNALFG